MDKEKRTYLILAIVLIALGVGEVVISVALSRGSFIVNIALAAILIIQGIRLLIDLKKK